MYDEKWYEEKYSKTKDWKDITELLKTKEGGLLMHILVDLHLAKKPKDRYGYPY